MVRYYGFYSNVARGKRKKNEQDELIPSILEPDGSSGECKRNWARLIQKIYEVDPLTCPKCSGKMKVISVNSSIWGFGIRKPDHHPKLPQVHHISG